MPRLFRGSNQPDRHRPASEAPWVVHSNSKRPAPIPCLAGRPRNYGNAKRWLINRLVIGYGVICGLEVQPDKQPPSIKVTAGAAIDKLGREIIVPRASGPVTIPAA